MLGCVCCTSSAVDLGAAAVARIAPAAGGYTMVVLRADSAWWTPGQIKAQVTVDSATTIAAGHGADRADSGGAYRMRFTFMDARGLDSLFAEGARLRAVERLVIDVRGNGRGNDLDGGYLRPLLYTQPVRSPGVLFLATDDNLRGLRH